MKLLISIIKSIFGIPDSDKIASGMKKTTETKPEERYKTDERS
jgi:hypothetical protein